MPPDCVFCGIIGGREPVSVVDSDEMSLAFMSTAPVNPGHLLVIPRAHARGLRELEPDTGAALFRAAQSLAAALRRSPLRCEGVNFFLADGESASQLVQHLHLHVIPRFAGDDFKLNAKGGVTTWENKPSREELDAAAQAIREALAT